MKIPFSIELRPKIESGEYKVVTRDDRPARIICWDRFATKRSDNCNIVALVTGTTYESTYYYYQDGHLWNKANGEGDSPLDLFIVIPEPELAESEEKRVRKGLIEVVSDIAGSWPFEAHGITKKEALTYLEKQKEDYSSFSEEQRKYMENYIPLDKATLVKLLAERDMNVAESIKSFNECFAEEEQDIPFQPLQEAIKEAYEELHSRVAPPDDYCWKTLAERFTNIIEKQKEQKPLSTEETELNSIAFLEQMGYTCIPPKKEHQNYSGAPKNALGGGLNSPLDKDKNLDDIAQDYVEAVKEYNPEPTWNLMQTAVCYGYHYREEEEQKPEWSEEDEKTIWGLTAYIPNEELERLGITRFDILKKLKSLCPPPIQLKEAYKDGFQTARHATALAFMNYCDKIRPNGKMCLSNGECEDIEKAFLVGDLEKIERYFHKCHWKPTKNQLDALNLVIMDYTEDGCIATANYLQEISAEIKKL